MAKTDKPKSKVPERIYLQWFGEDRDQSDEAADIDESDATWSPNSSHD